MTRRKDVVPAINAKALARAIADRDVQALMRALGRPEQEDGDLATDAPQLVVSDEAKAALAFMAAAIDRLPLPTERRELSDSEKLSLLKVFDDAKEARAALQEAEVAVREVMHRHLDVELEESGKATGVPVDSKGRYIAEGTVSVTGHARKAVRQVSETQNWLDADAVEALYREGKITRGQYLKVTRKVTARTVDETGLLDAVARDPKLAQMLAPAVRRGERSVSVYVRDRKLVNA